MRIAIQKPDVSFDQSRNCNAFAFAFLQRFKPVIYLPDWYSYPKYRKALQRHGWSPDEMDFAFTPRSLNHKADVLVSFQGAPHLPRLAPPPRFTGMKVYHLMDFVFRATEANQALERGGVDYVMGYTDHGRYCPFFQKYYPRYRERVIPVPFGYGERFENRTPLEDRIQKVIALGSVNPVDDPAAAAPEDLREYVQFYAGVRWTHQWRRLLVEHEREVSDIMDSQLPHFPKTKNPDYDAVALMNGYALFANDEGLMAFPPARTYEGTAAGSVMVCSDHPSYADVGFQDGVNCIMHRTHDIADFREKVTFYLENRDKLAAIQKVSTRMVRCRYSHDQVAQDLHADISKRWQNSRSAHALEGETAGMRRTTQKRNGETARP